MDTKTQVKFSLESIALNDVWTDFVLSRQSMQCTKSTLAWYSFTAGAFVSWLPSQGVNSPTEITAQNVRQYLVNLEGKSSNTIHGHARAIRTFLKFLFDEGHIAEVKFKMPKLESKRLLALTSEQIATILKACNPRDKALIALAVDSGLRREELCLLDWGDLNLSNGIVRVNRGKGGKARSAAVGASTRRIILKYRRTLEDTSDDAPLFQTSQGQRLAGDAVRHVIIRLANKTGIHFTAHSLRRTYATLSLKSGLDLVTIQRQMGHSDISMTSKYLTLLEDDLLKASAHHSNIDGLKK